MNTFYKNKDSMFPYEGLWPSIEDGIFVAPGAKVIGRVTLKSKVSIWFNCVLRGDVGAITVSEGTNIQDGTIVHVSRKNKGNTFIGKYVTIGHKAIIHSCHLESESFVGMGAIIMDGVEIGRHSLIAAGSLVPPNKKIKKGELWADTPSKYIRKLTNTEIKNNLETAKHYVKLSKAYTDSNIT